MLCKMYIKLCPQTITLERLTDWLTGRHLVPSQLIFDYGKKEFLKFLANNSVHRNLEDSSRCQEEVIRLRSLNCIHPKHQAIGEGASAVCDKLEEWSSCIFWMHGSSFLHTCVAGDGGVMQFNLQCTSTHALTLLWSKWLLFICLWKLNDDQLEEKKVIFDKKLVFLEVIPLWINYVVK